jgi:hypothetical protein
MILRIVIFLLTLGTACLCAKEPSTTLLPWKPVSLDLKNAPVTKVLQSLKEQTGVVILDEIGEIRLVPLLKLDGVPFWQAGDAVARGARAKLIASPRDGTLRLVRLMPGDREAPASYDGNFRVRLVRIASSVDLESDRSQCTCTLELVWLPPVRPLFVEGKLRQVKIRDVRNTPVDLLDEAGGLTAVDGRTSYTTDLTLPGFPRADATIESIEGTLSVIAPSKFLLYHFEGDLFTLQNALPGGALRQMKQADVTCRLEKLILARDRWTLQVGLEYPGGTKALESFQAGSLVVQNEMKLVSADGKRTLMPTSYVVESVSSRRAQVSYHFTDKPGSRRGQPKDWRIRYSAPERLIEVPVRFRFEAVPLP